MGSRAEDLFLHDGRAPDLLIAIEAHRSGNSSDRDASEANTVVGQFEALPQSAKQDILNFLRSL
jgi:CxxC motif-containing protein (DUF1111 family)